MTSHELAKKLLELPDVLVVSQIDLDRSVQDAEQVEDVELTKVIIYDYSTNNNYIEVEAIALNK